MEGVLQSPSSKKFMFRFIHFDPSLKEVARAEALQEVFP